MIQCIFLLPLLYLSVLCDDTLPIRAPTKSINESNVCETGMKPTASLEEIVSQVTPHLTSLYGPPCQGGGNWREVITLDMSISNQNCPSGWHLVHNGSVRGCAGISAACASTVLSVGSVFSKVCGQVIAVQFGTPDTLYEGAVLGAGIEQPYIDGVSITHGPPGSRQHIWSFAAANSDQSPNAVEQCPCSDISSTWPYSIPSFIGSDYFCDSGQDTFSYSFVFFPDDPLWDGQGCGPTSSCCSLNNPPWFSTNIGNAVGDDIEVRICADSSIDDEEIVVTKMELYIQ